MKQQNDKTSKADHTPGPWQVITGSVYVGDQPSKFSGADIRIALMDREEPNTSPVERDANAHLIAAAPDLLEALSDAAEILELHIGEDQDTGDFVRKIHKQARAAIAKAKKGDTV